MPTVDEIVAADYAICIGSALFVVLYSVFAPWWADPMGRSIVAFDVALLLALLPSALHYAFGLNVAHPWFAWYDLVSLWTIAAVTAWRIVAIVRVHRGSRASQASDHPT